QQLALVASQEESAKDLAISVSSVMESILEASHLVGRYIILGSNETIKTLHEHGDMATEEIARLRKVLQDNPEAIKRVDKLESDISKVMTTLDESFSMVDSGDRPGGIDHMRDLKGSLPALKADMVEVRRFIDQKAKTSLYETRRQSQAIQQMTCAALSINI